MRQRFVFAFLFCVFAATASETVAQDLMEFMSGAEASGKVVEIRKQSREVVFESQIGNRRRRRIYPYAKIHAVTYNGKRYVINQRTLDPGSPNGRSRSEIESMIQNVGASVPEWFKDTPLSYPDTLDLEWPHPAPKPWNNRKNIGQYIWDRINPNEKNWRSGIKLLHFLVTRHKDDSEKSKRIMRALAGMYFRLFQDYPRAAFWWRQADVSAGSLEGVGLAECYFRMGNKSMALEALDSRRLRVDTIKLLGSMGETDRAVAMADSYASRVKEPQWALLAAGDACRAAERYQQAIRYYKRVLEGGDMRNEQYERRATSRAQQSIDAIEQFELLDISKVADGSYEAESLGYEGPIAVKVVVNAGRIVDLSITQHKEKQYYSALRDVPAQVIAKQDLKTVDATSRATITAEAIVSAAAKALAGQTPPGAPKKPKASFR